MNKIHIFLLLITLFMFMLVYMSIVPCKKESFTPNTLYDNIIEQINKVNEKTKEDVIKKTLNDIKIKNISSMIESIKNKLNFDRKILSNTNSVETEL